MPLVALPFPEEGKNIPETVTNLTDTVLKLRKELEYLLQNLDEENVIKAQTAIISEVLAGTITADQIDTSSAKIQAAQIETLTVGGNVVMGPSATISYSQVTGTPSIPTVPSYITSTKITATTIESPTITGGTLIGGTVKTADTGARIELGTDNKIKGYNSSNQLHGLYINPASTYSDFAIYLNGLNRFDIYDGITEIALRVSESAKLIFNHSDGKTYPQGTWNCSSAGFDSLKNSSGTYYSLDGHSHSYTTVSDVISIVGNAIASAMSDHIANYHTP